ncbi:hypothetical protein FJZ53_05555 [Candidatus Woesearchaeota archaeon]|nr:hypothetical protein [Candidatus Woesearchaeota archaeon]
MKIPELFLQEKGLNERVDRLLKHSAKNHTKTVERIICQCEYFLEQEQGVNGDNKYIIGRTLANQIFYTKRDVEEFSKVLMKDPILSNVLEQESGLGFFFSALINKVLKKKEKINLHMGGKINGMGAYLERGELLVHGDVHNWAGFFLNGGTVKILGSARDYTAHGMNKGRLYVKDNLGGTVGYQAIGGEILFDNFDGGTVAMSCQANVYLKEKKIWPKEKVKNY